MSFYVRFRYIDAVFSLSNSNFGDHVDRIHHFELAIKGSTNIARYALYIASE